MRAAKLAQVALLGGALASVSAEEAGKRKSVPRRVVVDRKRKQWVAAGDNWVQPIGEPVLFEGPNIVMKGPPYIPTVESYDLGNPLTMNNHTRE